MDYELTTSEEDRLWRLLGLAYNTLMNAIRTELEPFGIQLVRAWALWGLKAMGRPATVAEMAAILDRDHQSTSQLLKRMEKDGLVKRQKGLDKRGTVTISLTPQGDELLGQIVANTQIISEVFGCLTKEEREILRMILEKLRTEALTRVAVRSLLPPPYASKLGL